MRNDWLTNQYFPGHPSRSDRATLSLSDSRLPAVLNFNTKVLGSKDMYWDLNMTEIAFSSGTSLYGIVADLSTLTPDFSHFDVLVDGMAVPTGISGRFVWSLHDGVISLMALSVNSLDQRGIPASVVVKIHR